MAFTKLQSNQPAANQKIFSREKKETRSDERLVGEQTNREMNPKESR
jgi:hypothetical protein